LLKPSFAFLYAVGGTAQQAVSVAAAKALAQGGTPAVAISKAFAIAIAIYGCPGVKPVISSKLLGVLMIYQQASGAHSASNVCIAKCRTSVT
jgi:hypothetical protein